MHNFVVCNLKKYSAKGRNAHSCQREFYKIKASIMEMRTEVFIPPTLLRISHQDKIMMIGSCFVENISEKMKVAGFNIDINPYGIAYNPLSISNGIKDLLGNKEFSTIDIFEHQGLFHSFSHHSAFSSVSPETCLSNINKRRDASSRFLTNASVLIITFGTAYVYKLKNDGKVVSNCHKLPDNLFFRERLSIEKIVEEWKLLITNLKIRNPKIKILFTVSPIRHWKDGANENQLSKSILLLAIDSLLQELNEDCFYFPSYEIMMDDLRDYRFYADDMIHPSNVAINYIWNKFSQTYFGNSTIKLITEWQNIQSALKHKPFNPDSKEHISFIEKTNKKLAEFYSRNPEFTKLP